MKHELDINHSDSKLRIYWQKKDAFRYFVSMFFIRSKHSEKKNCLRKHIRRVALDSKVICRSIFLYSQFQNCMQIM